ncbi:MAG TPA: M28 family peptidase [Polyangia bacterium]|nr:M28 family peptidase [Polyangia bacterium]
MFLLSLLLVPAAVPGVEAPAATAPGLPASWDGRERAVAGAISEQALAAHVRFLADDLLEGRGAGSRGDELAMRYVAAQFERLGLEPAGDGGGWLQRFELVGMTSQVTAPPVFSAPGRGGSPQRLELKPGVDMVVAPGQQREALSLTDAELVFVGYGIVAPEERWDDFKGVDVRGKVLVVMNNDPENDPALFGGKARLYYGRWDYKYEEAARHGAAGVIIIHTTPSAAYPWQVVQSSWSHELFELPAPAAGGGARPGAGPGASQVGRLTARMWATEEASRRLVALGGQDLDALRRRAESRSFRPVPLGVRLSVALKTELRRFQTANVLGRLRGSDPVRGREEVVFTAHHDHLGVGEAKNGDAIYNGALDNASGVGMMLTMAEALSRAEPRPRRSIVFAAVAAEESNLLGSAYFMAHPTAPLGRLAANLNVDGINIWGKTLDVTLLGLGKSTLDEVVRRVAGEQGRELTADPQPEKGSFYRSDQLSFARAGVPAVGLRTGTHFVGHEPKWGLDRIDEYVHTHYHQPSDQIDATWRLDGAVDDARLLVVTALRVADAPEMPAWRKGDEFEAARLKALKALK